MKVVKQYLYVLQCGREVIGAFREEEHALREAVVLIKDRLDDGGWPQEESSDHWDIRMFIRREQLVAAVDRYNCANDEEPHAWIEVSKVELI